MSWKPVRMLAVGVAIAWAVACESSGGDEDVPAGGGDTAGDTAAVGDVPEGGEDAAPPPVVPAELVGVYSFNSGVFESGTVTGEWQELGTPGDPDRQLKGTGALVAREDGTYVRISNVFARTGATGEPANLLAEDDRHVTGTWSVADGQLTATDEGEEPRQGTWTFAAGTGLLTIEMADPEAGEIQQVVWRRQSLDPDTVGDYDLASVTTAAGTMTPEAVTVGGHSYRVDGELLGAGDGTFQRRISMYTDDQLVNEIDGPGISFVVGDELVVTAPDQDNLRWNYEWDATAGQLTLDAAEAAQELRQLIWERRAE